MAIVIIDDVTSCCRQFDAGFHRHVNPEAFSEKIVASVWKKNFLLNWMKMWLENFKTNLFNVVIGLDQL